MAVVKENDWQQGGGVVRGEIVVKTDTLINVTTTATAAPTVTSKFKIPKHAQFTVSALDTTKNPNAAQIGIFGKATSDGANPSVITPYLQSTVAATVPANGFIKIAYEIPDGVNSD